MSVEKFTTYEVHVEAFNSMGASERTDPQLATTLEDGRRHFVLFESADPQTFVDRSFPHR